MAERTLDEIRAAGRLGCTDEEFEYLCNQCERMEHYEPVIDMPRYPGHGCPPWLAGQPEFSRMLFTRKDGQRVSVVTHRDPKEITPEERQKIQDSIDAECDK